MNFPLVRHIIFSGCLLSILVAVSASDSTVKIKGASLFLQDIIEGTCRFVTYNLDCITAKVTGEQRQHRYNQQDTSALPSRLLSLGLLSVILSSLLISTFATSYFVVSPLSKMAWKQLQILSQTFKTANIDRTRHGGELIGKVLKAHGIKNVFTLSGGHISPILVGAQNEGIRVIDTRHEVNAVFAADAVARVTGTPGVAVVTAGPGLTNTVTAVKNAQMAESPVLLMGGCAATLMKGRGALQDIDHMSVFKSITKWQCNVTTVRDIVPAVREALKQSQSGTPGPVFLELPLDILYQFPVVEKEFLVRAKGKGLSQRVLGWYLKNYANNLFHDGFKETEYGPLKLDIPMPSSSDVSKTALLLKNAKNPLILLGSQATIPPVAATELQKIIEEMGIPVYLGGMSRGLLGTSSKLQMRQNRKDALKEADVVLMGGMVADFRLGYGASLSPKSKIIAVNRDKSQLYKNAKIFWNPELAVQSDVGSFFLKLKDELKKINFSPPQDWLQKLRNRDEETEKKNAFKADQDADKYLNPVKVLHELDKVLPDGETYLVADGGDFVATASYIVRPKGPLKWLDPGAYGTLGCGGGFALGIKASKPDANVIIIYGDGSVGYTIMEYDTMVRHNLPCVAIVGNDACWTQIAREQVPMLGSDVACPLAYTDYNKVAESLGGLGIKLDDKNKGELAKCFQAAIERSKKEKKPMLINVLIGKTDFRAGSISV